MKPETSAATETERRKHVRLRRRGDLGITPSKYEGRTYYVVKDPVSLRYYRFKEQEHYLLQLMDGKHTLDDAQKAFEKQFRPDRLTLEDLEQFGQQLLQAGLVQNEAPTAGKQLFDQRKKRRRMELMATFTNILYIKLPIFDPDKLLTWMIYSLLPVLRRMEVHGFYTLTVFMTLAAMALAAGTVSGHIQSTDLVNSFFWGMALYLWAPWLFVRVVVKTLGFLALSGLIMFAAISLVLTHFEMFYSRLPSYHEFFSFKTVVYLWAALGAVKIIHEFGHGLSCKAFGGEVHEMGFLFLVFSPAMYCNVSDAWTMPNKWHRIIIGGAGIYVELIIAAIATFVWWNTPSAPFINNMCLSLMIVCSVSTVMFNGNPLMRYDGYYVLADWLEIPNLRDRSNRYLQRLVMEYCLGIEVQPEPYMELWRRILFLTYACVSWVYRWVITFVILYFMATFLRPYKLEIISSFLALFSLGSMTGWPLYRLLKNLHKRGRLPDMKTPRVVMSSIALGTVFLGFFVVPLPVTRVRAHGVVLYQPHDMEPVHVAVPGAILKKIHVKEGEKVAVGRVLAEFASPEKEVYRIGLRSDLDLKRKLVDIYTQRLAETRDSREKQSLQSARSQAEGERDKARRNLEVLEKEMERLVVVAPRGGYVTGVPQPEEVGKRWDREQGQPLCSIGDRAKLRVLIPVESADFDLVRANLKVFQTKGERLPVTIRVQGRDSKQWTGWVNPDLPRQHASEIPLQYVALTSKGGGPIAVRPSSDPSKLMPQAQIYLVAIDFEDPDEAICTGMLAHVKIHNQYESAAWWSWRAISQAIDLYLL